MTIDLHLFDQRNSISFGNHALKKPKANTDEQDKHFFTGKYSSRHTSMAKPHLHHSR